MQTLSRFVFSRGRARALRCNEYWAQRRLVSSQPAPHVSTSPSTRHLVPTHATAPGAPPTSAAGCEALALASRYLLRLYSPPPFVLSHGRGSRVFDTDGREFLDFSAGIAVNALGHADPGFVQALTKQAQELVHTSNVYNHLWSGKLAQLIVTLTQKAGGIGWAPGHREPDLSQSSGAKVFFANSGTEANEAALKVARSVGKQRWASAAAGQQRGSEPASECPKTRIVCFENSFHGRTMGALSVTSTAKYRAPFVPLLPGIDIGKLNDMGSLEHLVGPDTCGVIVEPIQGEGGIYAASVEWLRALRKRCDDVGAVLIFDEIQCGLYRTGTLWAHSSFPTDCHPDIVTMAKPLANGYPIGAVLMRDSVTATMTIGTHGTTFGGSPLACAMGYHVLSRLSADSSVRHVVDTSAHLVRRLERLPGWFPSLLLPTIRGRGFIVGPALRDTKDPTRMVELARERGLLVLTAGQDAVRLLPSLIASREDVDLAVDVLEGCLTMLHKEKSQ